MRRFMVVAVLLVLMLMSGLMAALPALGKKQVASSTSSQIAATDSNMQGMEGMDHEGMDVEGKDGGDGSKRDQPPPIPAGRQGDYQAEKVPMGSNQQSTMVLVIIAIVIVPFAGWFVVNSRRKKRKA